LFGKSTGELAGRCPLFVAQDRDWIDGQVEILPIEQEIFEHATPQVGIPLGRTKKWPTDPRRPTLISSKNPCESAFIRGLFRVCPQPAG